MTSDNLSIGQVLIISEESPLPPNPEEGIIHTVKSGDSLYKIANQYGVSVSDIMNLNNLTSTVLSIGQQILIPNQEVVEPSVTTYTVKSGDSLWKIANQYNISVDDIIKANNLTSTSLSIGQVLKIPTSGNGNTLPPTNYEEYTVQRGDSLWLIANRYNTTVNDIKNLNNLTSNSLSIGQVLKIPSNEGHVNYYVKSGDSLWSIANRYNTTVDRIKQLNNLTSNNLSVGQLLIIPN